MTTPKPRDAQVLDLQSVELEPDAAIGASDTSMADDTIDERLHSETKGHGLGWLSVFGSGLLGLILIGITVWAESLIGDLLARQPVLGWLAIGFAALAVLGLAGFLVREIVAMARLGTLDGLRGDVQRAYQEEDAPAARKALRQLTDLYAKQPRTAHGRARFAQQRAGVLDARDLIVIAEEAILEPLDREAIQLISSASRRVSLVTALSPRALIDIVMVAVQCLGLTRQIASLYGARPGFFGGLRLARHMVAHLAITGGMAATEGLVSQVLGHSLAARLSARLGEGVINGLLTARVGIAAIAVTRPMPFLAGNGPTLGEVTRGMASLGEQRSKTPDKAKADDEQA